MRKYLKVHRERWLGSMTENLADILLELRTMKSVPTIKNAVTNLNSQQVEAVLNHYNRALKKQKSFKDVAPPTLSEVKRGELEDYQTIGAAYMLYAKGVLLGDETGLGKTVQAAAFYNLLKSLNKKQGKRVPRMLFITENSAVTQIVNKLVQFTGDYFYKLDSAQKPKIEKMFQYDETFSRTSIVAPHSALSSQFFMSYVLSGEFDAIIIDEGSILRKKTNEMYKNAVVLFKQIEYRYVLNATPFEVHLKDMYNQLDIIDRNFLPYYGEFEKDFVRTKQTAFGREVVGFKNEERFCKRAELRYLARSREELGAVFEDNEYKIMIVPLSDEQKKIITKTTMKHQICDCPSSVYSNIRDTEENVPKLKALKHIVDEERFAGRRCLIFCKWREAQLVIKEELETIGYIVECINGDTKNRTEILEMLDRGEIDIVISTVYRAMDGGNIHTVVMYSLETNPQVMRQFEGRITRSFDVRNKSLYMIISDGYERLKLEGVVRMRVTGSTNLSVAGSSMLYNAVLDNESREHWDASITDRTDTGKQVKKRTATSSAVAEGQQTLQLE